MVSPATASPAMEDTVDQVTHVWLTVPAMGHRAASSVQGVSTYQGESVRTAHCLPTA